jgi:hypothetical protein
MDITTIIAIGAGVLIMFGDKIPNLVKSSPSTISDLTLFANLRERFQKANDTESCEVLDKLIPNLMRLSNEPQRQ